MQKNPDGTVTVRMRASGQVVDLIPDAARAYLSSGMAEELSQAKESTMRQPKAERAVSAAQAAPRRRQ